MMNSSLLSSYVAVVSKPRKYVPCPSSVCAYVPMHSNLTHFGIQYLRCSSSPCPCMVGMNIPRCKSNPPGSSINSRMMRATCIGSFSFIDVTAFGNAKYLASVDLYSSSRSRKYFPRLLNTSCDVMTSAIRRLRCTMSAPPCSSASSSRALNDALARSRRKSSTGLDVLATMTALDGAWSARVRSSTCDISATRRSWARSGDVGDDGARVQRQQLLCVRV
mmetsp:Transcript_8487/g.31605  ORF Transcript_8487/g.31605 Transcript_8487/m.31605 type:complete len:220 (-) Transcript_8487:12-671(-)